MRLTHVINKSGLPLASFPGCSHLQYLIASSMQIQRGKTWEIWSHAVMSGRQRVHGGHCPRVIIAISCWNVPDIVNDDWYWCCLANTLASSRQTDKYKKELQDSSLGTAPHVSTLCLTACDQIYQTFPFHICILQAIKYWRGNGLRIEASLCIHTTRNGKGGGGVSHSTKYRVTSTFKVLIPFFLQAVGLLLHQLQCNEYNCKLMSLEDNNLRTYSVVLQPWSVPQ